MSLNQAEQVILNNLVEKMAWYESHLANTYPAPYYILDGSNDYINMGTLGAALTSFSINTKFALSALEEWNTLFSGTNYNLGVMIGASGELRVYLGGVANYQESSAGLFSTNQVYTLSVNWNGTDLEVYVNNESVTLNDAVGTLADPSITAWHLGRLSGSSAQLFEGRLYSLSLYSAAKNAAERGIIYSGGVVSADLLASYDAGSMSSTSWNDKSGNGITGTVSGATLTNPLTADAIIKDASPTLYFYDTDGDDGDISAQIAVNLTTTTTGAEDADLTISAQIGGTLTDILSFDASGALMTVGGITTWDMGAVTTLDFDGTVALTSGGNINITEKVGILSAHDLGVGLHVKSGDAGAGVSVHTDADEVVIEGTGGHVGMTIAANDDKRAGLMYESPSSISGQNTAYWYYNGGDEYFNWKISNTNMLTIHDGKVGIENTSLESWHANYTALQLGGNGTLWGLTAQGAGSKTFLSNNMYFDGTDKYISTDEASIMRLGDGTFTFKVAASGTADNPITWTTALTIDNAGDATFGGDVVVNNSNYALEGYSTGRNVLRATALDITPGATPNTNISVAVVTTSSYGFNSPSITDGTDIAKSGSSGSFSLSASGKAITMNITENIVGVSGVSVMIHDLNSSSTTELYSVVALFSGVNLELYVKKRGAQTDIDWTTILDAGDKVEVLVSYITSS